MRKAFDSTQPIGFFLGFASMSLQVLYLRAFLATFYGNELSIGLLLALWLIWGGVGARLGSAPNHKRLRYSWVAIFALIFATAALGLAGARLVRHFFATSLAQPLDLGMLFFSSAFLTAVPCLLFGYLFAELSHMSKRNNPSGYLYFAETLGSLFGGLFSTFLNLRLGDDWLAFGLVAVLTLSALAGMQKKRVAFFFPFAALLFLGLFRFFALAERIEILYWHSFAADLRLVKTEQGRYGKLAILDWGGEFILYSNGEKVAAIPDPVSAQAQAALVLAQHPAPRSICLIGGGWGGLPVELLRHPHVSVDFCELDPQAGNLVFSLLSDSLRSLWRSDRLRIIYSDARYWLSRQGKYDLIVCAIASPASAQGNRFFTREFFAIVKSHLAENGRFLLLGLPGGENFLGAELLQLNGSINRTLQTVFTHVLYLPGDQGIFIAASHPAPEQTAELLSRRLQNSGVVYPFFHPSQLQFYYLPDRLAYFADILSTNRTAINRDVQPIGYYLDFLAWNKNLGGPSELLYSIQVHAKSCARWVFVALAAAAIFLSILVRKSKTDWHTGLVLAGFLLGFMAMTLQIVLLMAFQAARGFLYTEIGFALAVYMLGMAVGAASALRLLRHGFRFTFLLVYLLLAAATTAVLPWILEMLFALPALALFMGLFFVCGGLGGFCFPLYTVLDDLSLGTPHYGRIYAYDLWGGALGASLGAGVGVPLLGFRVSLGFLAGVLLIALFYFMRTRSLLPRPARQIDHLRNAKG